MHRLGQIQLQKTVTVKVQCNLNDEIVVRNFKILMDCLKDLNANYNDLSSKFFKITDRVSNLQQHNNNNQNEKIIQSKQNNQKSSIPHSSLSDKQLIQSQKQNLLNLIKRLDERTTQNENNILGNKTDINLINKQIQDLKQLISKINNEANNSNQKQLISKINNEANNSNQKQNNNKDELINSEVNQQNMNNIRKEIKNNKELIVKTNQQLDRIRKQIESMKQKFGKNLQDHEKRIKSLQNNSNKSKNDDGKTKNEGENNQPQKNDLNKTQFNEFKQKLAALNKKTNGLQILSQQLKKQTSSLGQGQNNLSNTCKNLDKQIQVLKQKLNNLQKNNKASTDKNDKNGGSLNTDELRQLKNQLKQLRNQVQQLKRERENNNHSKTSIEEDRKNKFERGALTQVKFKDDSLKDLIARIQFLQKMMGSKNSIDDKQKLPLIKRNKMSKERDTSIQQKSTSNKKDFSQLKTQIQVWVHNFLTQMKDRDSLEDIEMKLQQIKNNLSKKADQQGMKKGLTFLQSKITQLYLFLTEPQGDDAMIVRKGLNCLSCSKKVEKLRGKIGPHINWNNMTSTNYSPPKVGYSRHMGQDSGDKEEDQQ